MKIRSPSNPNPGYARLIIEAGSRKQCDSLEVLSWLMVFRNKPARAALLKRVDRDGSTWTFRSSRHIRLQAAGLDRILMVYNDDYNKNE